MAVPYLLDDRFLQKVLETLVRVDFPKCAHGLTSPLRNDFLFLNFFPERGPSGLCLVDQSQIKNLDCFRDRVVRLVFCENNLETSNRGIYECDVVVAL